MFVKLFFWFWLATVLSGIVFFFLAFNLRLGPMQDERKRHLRAEHSRILNDALVLYGSMAAETLEKKGVQALVSAAAPRGTWALAPALFSSDGTPLSATFAPEVRNAVRQRVSGAAVQPGPSRDLVVVQVKGPSGKSYLAAAQGAPGHGPDFPGEPPKDPFRHYPFPPEFWLQMLSTFVVSGIVCYILSWRLTAPIRRLRAAAQDLAGGNLAARVAIGRAGTGDELSDLGRDFNLMALRLEKLVNAHRQLVRDVSHELRSPLARMNVALGIARKQSPESAEPALARIEQEGERLNFLIGELLTLSQLDGGAAGEKTEVDLGVLTSQVAHDADFEARGSERYVNFAPVAGLTLRGNPELLRRALENVVRNAVRYTPEGSCVDVVLERAQGSFAVLRVRDYGPGVPESQLVDIFRPFYRVAEARDRQSGGTGIGLAISERTVALHGGTILARNHPDGGLEVEIRLPLG
jgi:two-component system sensor histidine kinase CpxA